MSKRGTSVLESAVAFFASRHVLANLIFLAAIVGGTAAWFQTSKEELPAATFPFVSIAVVYPGAPAADVEYFVTRPLEEVLRSVDGIERLRSTSSVGQANVVAELSWDLADQDAVLTEIRNAVLDVQLPDDVVDDPKVRVFETTKKAILDVALIRRGTEILDVETRRELQRFALALENRLVAMPQVHSVSREGYRAEEIHVRAHPERLRSFEIPLNTLLTEIRANHLRQPAGTLEADEQPKVTLLSELTTPERLRSLIVQGGFDGRVVRLGEVADVVADFEKADTVVKVNGHEAVMFNVVKSPSRGILEALEATKATVEEFRRTNLRGSPIEVVLLDDESIDLRNRLKIVSQNGAVGFGLVLFSLFLFLDVRSGIWVALGIPFTLGVTMMGAFAIGFSVNGITLAAVIIVMGMIVDDAIVVAENVARMAQTGMDRFQAVVEGTTFVFLPIVASIATTCVAFVPLFFFGGHYGKLNGAIPPVVFLMLGASLFESLFILPSHLTAGFGSKRAASAPSTPKRHWFDLFERGFGGFLRVLLRLRWLVLAMLLAVFVHTIQLGSEKLSFVLYPNEETRDIVLSGRTAEGSTRYQTARKLREIEDLFAPLLGREVVGYRTNIARSRRGGPVEENQFRMLIEIVPREQRDRSADQLIELFEAKIANLEGFSRVAFRKSRWGQDSGSPIEILVQQNDDAERRAVTEALSERLRSVRGLTGIEIERGLLVPEYRIDVQREKLKRLSISPRDLATTLRTALEGTVLYEFPDGDEETRVRLTTTDSSKRDIERVLRLPVENRGNYLVPLRDLVSVEKVESPSSIARRDSKRTTEVYADIVPGSPRTPLDVADELEARIFPEILSQFPTTTLSFQGEVRDTRESTQDFRNAVLLALALVYGILAILFDSPWKPLVIMLAIPFGVVGVILAFLLHGKLLFGFFAGVGVLGLAGIVVNDSIILVAKLDHDLDREAARSEASTQIAAIAQTRLRAVLLTTLTTVAGLVPTAYGLAGYDATLAEMMLALTWGLSFGTVVTLVLVPCLYGAGQDFRFAGRWLRSLVGSPA